MKKAETPTFADAQKYLRAFFKTANNGDCQRLWYVLSALRGPDYKEQYPYPHKNATTAVIRRTFFGDQPILHLLVDTGSDSKEHLVVRQQKFGSSHFCRHAREAFDVLGLKWDEYNPPKEAE